MGIRTIAWAPGGRWIALGGWDGKVRIVESEGWRCVATLTYGVKTVEKDMAVLITMSQTTLNADILQTVWREASDWLRESRGRGIVQCPSSKPRLSRADGFPVDRLSLPASIPTARTDLTRSPPRAGISQINFDAEATLLLVRVEHQPNVIHIHRFLPTAITHLASIVFSNPVKNARWCPKGKRIATTTRIGAVYIWDGEGGWVEDGEEVRGGMMEGIGVPSRE